MAVGMHMQSNKLSLSTRSRRQRVATSALVCRQNGRAITLSFRLHRTRPSLEPFEHRVGRVYETAGFRNAE
jgi:hypothetical protein